MTRADLALVICLAPVPLLAQPLPPPRSNEVLGGFFVIGGGPTGYFGQVVGSSAVAGLGGHVSLTPRARPLGVRFEVTYLEIGSEKTRMRIDDGREYGDRTTTNGIFGFATGPIVMLRHGSPRPYALATVGTSWFRTGTLVTADCDASCDPGDYPPVISDQTNSSDWTFSWRAGGGVLVSIGRYGWIDLGVRYAANSTVTWLAKGDVAVDASGQLQAHPRHSAVNLVEVTLGWTFGP